MKKALIITYYWPPSGGAGVQRWLKFVKYLKEFGWEPIVYTPQNPEYPALDHSLETDIPKNLTVLKTSINEPYSLYKRFVGRKKNDPIKAGFLSEKKNPSIAEKISVWIRGNFFIPDARMFWIKPSVIFLTDYLKVNPVDVVISTGPPHSMHLIAKGLKEKTGIPWLADFRDPWTNIDFYQDLMLTARADRKHRFLEKGVLRSADSVVVISEGMKTDFNRIYPRKYEVITNGFDEDDVPQASIEKGKKFAISHIGSLVKSRNPETLWQTLEKMIADNQQLAGDLKIRLVGKTDWTVRESLKKFQLEDFVEFIDYLPHNEVVQEQSGAEVLLLLINQTPNAKMILTGKFFEYMAAGKPILCIGPEDGDAARIIAETGIGLVAGFEDQAKTEKHIAALYGNHLENRVFKPSGSITSYSRRNLTRTLAEHLNTICSQSTI